MQHNAHHIRVRTMVHILEVQSPSVNLRNGIENETGICTAVCKLDFAFVSHC